MVKKLDSDIKSGMMVHNLLGILMKIRLMDFVFSRINSGIFSKVNLILKTKHNKI